jgi:hypothetical protein
MAVLRNRTLNESAGNRSALLFPPLKNGARYL